MWGCVGCFRKKTSDTRFYSGPVLCLCLQQNYPSQWMAPMWHCLSPQNSHWLRWQSSYRVRMSLRILPIPVCSLNATHAPSPCRGRDDDQRKPMSQGRGSGGGISCSLAAEKAGMEEYRDQQGDLDWMQVRRGPGMGGEPTPERLRGPVTLIPSFTFSKTLLSVLSGGARSDSIQDGGMTTQISHLTCPHVPFPHYSQSLN